MATPNWTTKSTKIQTGVTVVDPKLTTITTANPGGWTKVSTTSTDPIVQRMEYAIQTDGKVTYRYFTPGVGGSAGAATQYNSLQEMTGLVGGVSGFNNQTSLRVTDSMQNNLVNRSNQAGAASPTAPTPDNPPAASNANSAAAAPDGQNQFSYDPNKDSIGSRINYYPNKLLVYPLNRQGIGGDYIQFQILKYKKSGLEAPGNVPTVGTKSNVALVGMEYRKSEILATICLPIQSGIVDSMSVDWGGGELNPITAAFANVAYSQISSAGSGNPADYFKQLGVNISGIGAKFSNASPELRKMMINYFVQQAVNTNGLLSRTVGGALNNNLELLFNGPMLRSFTFNFKLTPREPKEAKVIKDIIRYFKKSMAPALSQSQLFLLAPNVFKLRYIYTGRGDKAENHPYLNRIKVAALRDFSVNYTPDGNYMTYKDGGSMTQYDLSMTFGEIDPIYENDYEQGDGTEGMGW